MRKCPYLMCDNEFSTEYSFGNCDRCQQPVFTCPDCGEYNREFAKFCRMCGKPIDHDKVEKAFYTRKLKKSPNIILNLYNQKPLDFIGSEGGGGMAFLNFSGNRVIITTSNGYLYDWDFFSGKELNKIKIPDTQFTIKPLLLSNMLFLPCKSTLHLYNLLTCTMTAVKLKNDSLSIITTIQWQENLYGLFIDTRKKTHVFAVIDTENGEIDDVKEMDGYLFSPNILQTREALFFFSKNAVYLYSKKEGKIDFKVFDKFPKKSLNILAKLYFMPDMNLLYIPEENNILRLNIQNGQHANFIKQLKGAYYVDYTENRAIVADDNGLQICNYNGKKLAESRNETFTKNLTFNYQPDCMKTVSQRLLFTFATQNKGGGYVIPWTLDQPRLISGTRQITGSGLSSDIISNIDISRNFVGLITSANEVHIWQF